jgi:hypothetical protein
MQRRRSRTTKSLLLGLLVAIFAAALVVSRRQARRFLRRGRAPLTEAAAPGEAEPTSPYQDETRIEPADDLEQLPRSELYRRAQAAGIRGRSGMSRAQLIGALRPSRERGNPTRSGQSGQ